MIQTTLLSLFTVALLPFVISNPTPPGVPAHFPISRRSNKTPSLAKAAEHLRAKYNFKPLAKVHNRAGNTAALPITNQVSLFTQDNPHK